MATLVPKDRVKETSTTTGTGTYTLAGAATGFRTFTSVLSNSETCFYCATDDTDWEVGVGTFTTSGTTLARTTILASSNANAAVDWAAGTRNIFITLPAGYGNPLTKVTTTHAIRVSEETALSSTLGNARGTGAVDLQTKRSNATEVANGNYSTISGGIRNTASGTHSVVGGGISNTASGNRSVVSGGGYSGLGNLASGKSTFIGGGYKNTASADYTVSVGGTYNVASGQRSDILGGQQNTASAVYSVILAGQYAKADKYGQQAYASGRFSAQGDAQTSLFVLRNQTTNATPTELYLNGSGASQRMTLANDTSWAFEILVIARRTDADSTTGAWKIMGAIDRQTNAASTALVAEPSLITLGADNTGWAVAASADTTNGSLKITATGATSQTVNFVARVVVTETTG